MTRVPRGALLPALVAAVVACASAGITEGHLRADGTRLVNPDGTAFAWRGITAFRLLDFVADGQEPRAVEYLTFAAYVALVLNVVLRQNIAVATVGAMAATALLAVGLHFTVLRPLRHTELVSEHPTLAAYKERCEARPAFAKALAGHMAPFAAAAG